MFDFKLWFKLIKRKFASFAFLKWALRDFTEPSPQLVKLRLLRRNSIADAIWVETGTYLGETTNFLSKISTKNVYSIEPEPRLFAFAKKRLRKQNIQLIFGTSQEVFETLLSGVSESVNFWLDGHNSGDITFNSEDVTPIIYELQVISKYSKNFGKLAVFIDDVRGFPIKESNSKYPTLDYLVNWARELNLDWKIEHDIFMAFNHEG
jgi:hypothetical protein